MGSYGAMTTALAIFIISYTEFASIIFMIDDIHIDICHSKDQSSSF
jgi:hypothetical protein